MRAVSHLAQRCRQTEAAAAEADGLREELQRILPAFVRACAIPATGIFSWFTTTTRISKNRQ